MDTRVLIAGGDTPLGRYMREVFSPAATGEEERKTPVTTADPDASGHWPRIAGAELAIVCSADGEGEEAWIRNEDATAELLRKMEAEPPRWMVLVTSVDVYGRDEGELLREDTSLLAHTAGAKSRARAEALCRQWCEERGVVLTILRPAQMFGTDVRGEGEWMFRMVARSLWFDIRDVSSRRSIVTTLDVALAAKALYRKGGTYNVADGRDRELSDLASAMSANTGKDKRMPVLVPTLAKLLARVADRFPALKWWAGREALEFKQRTLTFSTSRLKEAAGMEFFDTVEVVARRDKTYPYQTK